METVRITVNGMQRERRVAPWHLLVEYLRETEGLKSVRVGCDTSQCGACTVLMGGVAVKSCTVLAIQADGSSVETAEGVHGPGALSDLQEALGEERVQCGYCVPGVLMALESLLRANGRPTESQVRAGLEGNVCRCGGYDAMVTAALRAATARGIRND